MPVHSPAFENPAVACDLSRKFVRVTALRPDGLVAFEFAIGWPEMAVELVLPKLAFDEFCRANQVLLLEAQQSPASPSPPPESAHDR